MTARKNNNKTILYIDNLFYKKKFHIITKRFRILLNNSKNDKLKLKAIDEYLSEAKKLFDYEFDRVKDCLVEYLKTDKINYKKVKINKCFLLYLNKELSSASNRILGGGVYLEIDENASIDDIYFFIEKNGRLIKELQEKSRQEWNIKKEPRMRKGKNQIRDLIIYELSKVKDKSIFNTGYKDIKIAEMMNEFDYKVTCENVRKIISRQKKIQG